VVTVITLLVLAIALAIVTSVLSFVRMRRQAQVTRWRAEGANAVPVTHFDLPVTPRASTE
jgi:hypothetical protein